jgi:hypothetical protein
MKKNARFTAGIPFLTAMMAALLTLGCAKEVRHNAVPDVKAPDKIDAFCPEFEQEGFISGDLYRIVVVVPKGADPAEISSVEKTARQRALSSLQKFLISQDRVVDQNITAELLRLLESGGALEDTHCKSESRDIFYYNVKKENLRGFILGIARKR